jgi:2,3-bisphosphoglycerate-dependent phosphoglycerate mutase
VGLGDRAGPGLRPGPLGEPGALDRARPGAESLAQLTAGALSAITALADEHSGGRVLVGSHGAFVGRLLAGLGRDVDWPCCCDMPMPAVYRLSGPGPVRTAVG